MGEFAANMAIAGNLLKLPNNRMYQKKFQPFENCGLQLNTLMMDNVTHCQKHLQ
jgi:hypothetical protein